MCFSFSRWLVLILITDSFLHNPFTQVVFDHVHIFLLWPSVSFGAMNLVGLRIFIYLWNTMLVSI